MGVQAAGYGESTGKEGQPPPLIGRLDPNAYASGSPGQIIDPVVFVDRR
jgi:hypothetical protein